MHGICAIDKAFLRAGSREISGSAAAQDCVHCFQRLGFRPPTRAFTSLTQRDSLPGSASFGVSDRIIPRCIKRCLEFADILHDGGLNHPTHLYKRED